MSSYSDIPIWNRIELMGIRVDAISLDLLLTELRSCILQGQKTVISNVNIHAMNIAYESPWFRRFLNQSHLTFCDGVGIKLAAMLTGQRLEYRFTPPDFMDELCERAARCNWKIYFLGAKPGISRRAAEKLVEKFPRLQIKTHHGYFDKTVGSQENQIVIDQINQFHPAILILGLGMPLQEKWILENMDFLDIKIAFPAGALFDYLSNDVPRAPRWMTDNGFEWLGRLLIEPRRLWKRYILGNPLFFWRIFVHHILGYPLPK